MELKDQDIPGPKRDFIGYGRHQPQVVWPDHANVVVNLVVNYEDGSEYALNKGNVWFTRRIDIARWWLDHHHEFV